MAKLKGGTKLKSDSKLFAFLATFLSIVGFVLAIVIKQKDRYVMHYAKQSLVLFIASVIVWVVGWILVFIPLIGGVIFLLLEISLLVLWVISWVYALSGKEKEIPLIGQFAEKLKC